MTPSTARPAKYIRTVDDGGDVVEDGGGWSWWLLLIPALVIVIVIGLIGLWALRGGDEDGVVVVPTETATAQVVETPPETPPLEETARPALSGTYVEEIVVTLDPAGHEDFVGMPEQMQLAVLITRDTSTGAITIDITGPPPWVALHGTAQFGPGFTSAGGEFTATGQGTVAGYPNVTVDFSGSVTTSGGLQGTLRMGINGELPTGQSISYSVSGERL
jgi:hypothetical protein